MARAAGMAATESSSEATGAMMSMTGLANRPTTAVLPMCSISPTSQGDSAACSASFSASNWVGHSGLYGTTSIIGGLCNLTFELTAPSRYAAKGPE